MAGRGGAKRTLISGNAKVRRRRILVTGGAVGAFLAAAAMAAGSAAPAKADFEELLDPIIQPLLTSVTDSLAGFDPTLATDLTTWTDTFLADLNSLDSATAVAAAAVPAQSSGDIPIKVLEGTEPTVQATIDGGANQTLLVDTGSSGLLVPWDGLGSNELQSFEDLLQLGAPTGINVSGFSGGVEYVYLEYNDATVDYGNGAFETTNTPVDVEIFSWPTSATSPASFDQFLTDNESTGILGIGDSKDDAGPGVGPFEAAGDTGVTVDIDKTGTAGDLIIGSNPAVGITLTGAPTPVTDLTEIVKDSSGNIVGQAQVSDDVDSGGVYGTIPSSIGSVANGDTITVEESNGTVLYTYTVADNGVNESPTVVSGTSIDSGFGPFAEEPIYIDYANDTLTFFPTSKD